MKPAVCEVPDDLYTVKIHTLDCPVLSVWSVLKIPNKMTMKSDEATEANTQKCETEGLAVDEVPWENPVGPTM